MNCESFIDVLFEYLDDSLDATVRAAADEHLQECAACRTALEREEALAGQMRNALQHATAKLSLRPATLHQVTNARESDQAEPGSSLRTFWRWFASSHLRMAGASATLLLIALGVFVSVPERQQSVPKTHSVGVAHAGANNYVIDVPMQNQTRVFQHQGDRVVDAVAYSFAVGHVRLSSKP